MIKVKFTTEVTRRVIKLYTYLHDVKEAHQPQDNAPENRSDAICDGLSGIGCCSAHHLQPPFGGLVHRSRDVRCLSSAISGLQNADKFRTLRDSTVPAQQSARCPLVICRSVSSGQLHTQEVRRAVDVASTDCLQGETLKGRVVGRIAIKRGWLERHETQCADENPGDEVSGTRRRVFNVFQVHVYDERLVDVSRILQREPRVAVFAKKVQQNAACQALGTAGLLARVVLQVVSDLARWRRNYLLFDWPTLIFLVNFPQNTYNSRLSCE